MRWEYALLFVPLGVAAGSSLLLSARAWRRDVAGASTFAMMMLVAAGWAVVYLLLLASDELPAKLVWYRLEWIGFVLMPAMWFVFALELTGDGLSRRRLGLLLVMPACFLVLAWTNDAHGLMWTRASADPGPLPTLSVERGVGAWLFFAYAYVQLGLATALLLHRLWRPRRLYRQQAAALAVGALAPMLGNLAYTFGVGPWPNLDLTPFGFGVTGVAFGWGLLRVRLLDLVPIATPVAHRAIFESMVDGVLVLDRQGFVVDLNPAAARILGEPAARLIGQPVTTYLPGVVDTADGSSGSEFVRATGTGSSRRYDVRLSPLRHWSGLQSGCLVALRDVTERGRAEEAVRSSEQRFRALLRGVSDVIAVLDLSGRLQYLSPAAQTAWGHAPESLLGQSAIDLVHPDDRASFGRLLAEAQAQPGTTLTTSGRLRYADGAWRDFELILSDLRADPAVGGIVATWRDTTERKAFELELTRLAFHDSVTNLPNRTLFMDRLEHAYARVARARGRLGVLFVDLDNFKIINDSLGHQAGDAVLVETARRLQSCLRESDTAARLGGDEFTVLLEDLASLDDAVAVAERLAAALRAPIQVAGREVFMGTSIGIALSSPAQQGAADLLRSADLAMYEAKRRGKGRCEVFDERTLGRVSDRLDLETDLRHAIERGEFRVHYQPIVDLRTERIVEVEALARWEHPLRGHVPPNRFIPVAEETGLIVPIGQWVLEQACRQAAAWQRAYPHARKLVVSVNLSARQFQHPTLVADIGHTLRQTGLAASSLKLEITESVVMQDAEAAIVTLRALKSVGIQLAIDDFGTGYSSLSYLKILPVDTLKIDRSFVDGLGHDPQDTAIVRSIIALARTLHLSVTGEGIETAAQQEHLQQFGCHRGQGYLFARPLPANDLDVLLGSGHVPVGTRQAA